MANELARRIFGSPDGTSLLLLAALCVLLLAAAWSDLRRRRIPNAVVFPGALLAVLLHALSPAGEGIPDVMAGGLGAWQSMLGMLYGLLALLPLYAARSMGAGDVKLMAMVGAFVGPQQIWSVLFATALAGGVLAVAVALRRGVLLQALDNVRRLFGRLLARLAAHRARRDAGARGAVPAPASSGAGASSTVRLPYAVAIAGGSIAYLLLRAHLAGFY